MKILTNFFKNLGGVILVAGALALLFGFVVGVGVLGYWIGSHWDTNGLDSTYSHYEYSTWPGELGFWVGIGVGVAFLVAFFITIDDHDKGRT